MSARKLFLWSEYPLICSTCIIPGYLGGSVLSRLLAHPSRDTFEITAIVRSAEKAKKLTGQRKGNAGARLLLEMVAG